MLNECHFEFSNPEFNLLDEGEWPGFLRDAGYEYRPYDVEEIKKTGYKDIERYSFAYDF